MRPAIKPVPVRMTRLSNAPFFRVPAHNAGAANAIGEWLDGTDEFAILADHDEAIAHERDYRESMGTALYFDWGHYNYLSGIAEAAEADGNWIDADSAVFGMTLLNNEAEALYAAHHTTEDYALTGARFPL